MTAFAPAKTSAARRSGAKSPASMNFGGADFERIFDRADTAADTMRRAAGSLRLPLVSSWQKAISPLPEDMKNSGEYARSIPQTRDIL